MLWCTDLRKTRSSVVCKPNFRRVSMIFKNKGVFSNLAEEISLKFRFVDLKKRSAQYLQDNFPQKFGDIYVIIVSRIFTIIFRISLCVVTTNRTKAKIPGHFSNGDRRLNQDCPGQTRKHGRPI